MLPVFRCRDKLKDKAASWLHRHPSGEVQVPPEAINGREAFLMEKLLVPAGGDRNQNAFE
jgi:hypothetical protein